MLQVTFREIASVLQAAGSQVVAAEGHGCLCGALCTSPDYSFERWLEEVVADVDSYDVDAATVDAVMNVSEPDPALQLLFVDTRRALRGDEMEFEPLLPDDDETLEQRATALSQWCQGFLYGFGTGRPIKDGDINEQIEEILRDVSNIARTAVDVGAAGEDEEQAYTEVVEYLRVSVQLVHDELTSVRNGSPAIEDDLEDGEGPEFPSDYDDSDPIH